MPHLRTLKKTGGPIVVTIEIDQAQRAVYKFALRNFSGDKRRELGEGDNTGDTKPDSFEVSKTPAPLRSMYLVYHIIFAAPITGPGQKYFAQLRIYQAGEEVPGDPIIESGTFEHSANAIGSVEFELE